MAALVATLPLWTAFPAAPAGAAVPYDGTTEATAAPSCWWIKQADPGAPTGTYWLQTPALIAPQQFHCDMTTDGGGWVLVARGREDWSFETQGQRTAADVRNLPDGTAAFAAAALDSKTIDGLLNGGAVRDLPDGVRVRRARTIDGTSWQEIRMHFRDLTAWAWGWGGSMPLASISINGTSYAGSNTADTMLNFYGWTTNGLAGQNNDRRLVTKIWSTTNYKLGFTYGQNIEGSTSSTSYLYRAGSNTGYAMPFAQVWLRPRLGPTDVSYAPVPSDGLPAIARQALLTNSPSLLPWGVSGVGAHTYWPRHEVPVWAFQQIGSTMYVGGMFTTVRNGPSGPTADQPFLAAFNATTGEWIDTFRPDVEGPVYDMEVLPDGRLLIAGEFLDVGGVAGTQGVAVLDPTTGAADPAWRTDVAFSSGIRPVVKATDVEGGYVYLAGDFDRARRDGQSDFIVFRAVRVSVTNGLTDFVWRPAADGQINDVEASPDRVWFAGYFGAINQSPNTRVFAAVNTTNGATIPDLEPYVPSNSQDYQQAVLRSGDGIYVAGSEHVIQRLDVATHHKTASHTTMPGGDFQTMGEIDGVVYGTCHCNQWVFAGALTWPNPGSSYHRVDRVRYMVALDAATGAVLPEFYPRWEMSTAQEGPWTMYEDAAGCAWVGGDVVSGAWNGTGFNWAGGFAKLCPRDATPPARPADLSAATVTGNTRLAWTAVSGAARYEVLRDDRVIASVTGTTFVDAGIVGRVYAVRALDAAGNRSATTATAQAAPDAPGTFLASGALWRYRDDGTTPPADWLTTGDLSGWPEGPAELGWGDGDESTVMSRPPLIHWLARDIDASAVTGNGTVRLRVRRDDGVRVFLDGLQVLRDNVSAANTYASSSINGSAETAWISVDLPTQLFGGASQRMAATLHQAWSNNPDGSFDLSLQHLPDNGDLVPPAAVDASATVVSGTVDRIDWTPASDDVAVGWIVVQGRTGGGPFRTLRLLDPSAVTAQYTHPAGEAWEYRVQVIDTNSNATVSDASSFDPLLIDHTDVWRWKYDQTTIPSNWTAPDFDDSSWASGPGKLGFGDTGLGTVIRTDPAPHPITAYFRTTMTIDSVADLSAIDLEVFRDDGVVVYVNGVEVGRNNMPAGTIAPNTFASTSIHGSARYVPVTMTVPVGLLHDGVNTVTAEVHLNYRSATGMAFSLKAVASP